jgi:hypothetical protein
MLASHAQVFDGVCPIQYDAGGNYFENTSTHGSTVSARTDDEFNSVRTRACVCVF